MRSILVLFVVVGLFGRSFGAPICNLEELGQEDFDKCNCDINRQHYSHLLDLEIQMDCMRCLKDGSNVYLVRGARLECVPCSKFTEDDPSQRFFTLHFIAIVDHCPRHFVPANYRQKDVGCGVRGE